MIYKKWSAQHTISAWSHFYKDILPYPLNNNTFYTTILKNLFSKKISRDLVEIELIHDTTLKNVVYNSIKITPSKDVKIDDIVDIKTFVEWFNKRIEELLFKIELKGKTIYSYNDGYTRYSIVVDNIDNCLIIDCKHGGI